MHCSDHKLISQRYFFPRPQALPGAKMVGDHLVDLSHAERNAAWAGERARLVVLPRGDHNSIFYENRESYLSELGKFAAECA